MPPPFLPLLAVAASLLGLPVGDDEIVAEFRRYFRKYEDSATRVEAVLALEGTESTEVVEALVPILRDEDARVVAACVRVLARLEAPEPVAAVVAALESERRAEVRAGLLEAVASARWPSAAEAVRPLLVDRDWTVRRRAVTALAALAGAEAEADLLPRLDDRETAVRCAAFDALGALRAEAVLEPALGALEDPSWQVRASAIAALGALRRKSAIEPLIACMEREEGRLRADAGAALERITGRAFGARLEGWQQFWATHGERFEPPTDAELARLAERRAELAAQYGPAAGTHYHGIDTPSRAIVFVVDVSSSMQTLVTSAAAEAGETPPRRIDVVRRDLQRTLEGLEPHVRFNVLAFATEIDAWKKGLVSANPLNRSSAFDWVGRLEPVGAASANDLAHMGLAPLSDPEAGKTNTWGALERAMAAGDARAGADDYEGDVDTIFLLSDGRPSHGAYVDVDAILEAVREANELRRIAIHTIAIGRFNKVFLQRLAQENGGVFVDLGE